MKVLRVYQRLGSLCALGASGLLVTFFMLLSSLLSPSRGNRGRSVSPRLFTQFLGR